MWPVPKCLLPMPVYDNFDGRQPPYYGKLVFSASSSTTERIQTRSLYWNCCSAGVVRHSLGCWNRRCSCSDPSESLYCLRHSWLWDSTAASTVHLRHHWRCSQMAQVVPAWLQYVRIRTSCSSIIELICGVPKGPVLFILYTTGIILLIESFGLTRHLYADDIQIYGSCPPAKVNVFSIRFTACSCAVASWMQSNRLRLNSDKTEALWGATTRCQHQLPRTPLLVDGIPIDPVQSVRDLGIFINADLVMRMHVQMLCGSQGAVFYPTLCANDYIPDSYHLTRTVEAGLRKCHFGRSSSLPSSLTSAQQHDSSLVCVAQTTSRMHSSLSIGSEPRKGYCSRWPCSHTRPFTELHRYT